MMIEPETPRPLARPGYIVEPWVDRSQLDEHDDRL